MSTKMTMTTKILIWMAAGLVLGSLINATLSQVEWVQSYLVNGLFHVVGAAFISLLKMLVVPLVTFSLLCGVCGLGDINKLGRVGIKAFLLFIFTTALAVALAIAVAILIGPGQGFEISSSATSGFVAPVSPPLAQVIIDLIPTNPVAAYASGDMLQVIIFTVLFGLCILMVGERGKPIIDLSERLNEVMMQMVNIVMYVAPYGVFALMAKTFALQGVSLILPMAVYFGTVALVLVLHLTGTLMLLLRTLARVNVWTFMKKMRTAQVFAFSTSSSTATIPITLTSVEKRLGVDKSTASFVVPCGATINMDGTAIMQGVATVFIANVYGVELGLMGYLTVIIMAVLASIGTAGVPGAGLVMLAMVLNQVGLPVEGIALIMGVDRLLDMMRTAVNITGDAVVATIVAKSEGSLNLTIYNDANAGLVDEVPLSPSASREV